ncbi:MAG: type II secretion system protein [Cyanobacteria bacterium P01_F01_bin.150]
MSFSTRLGHKKYNVTSDQGLSLIEALVAIVVIAITGAMMLPPMFLTAATRVQNRRAEQALQVAQSEIDRVRTLVEQDQHNKALNLPFAISGGLEDVAPPKTDDVNTPMKSVKSSCNQYEGKPLADALTLVPVDMDADCTADFYMQVFRTEDPSEAGVAQPDKFQIGVRVFAASVKANLGNLTDEDVQEASLKYTTGQGNQSRRPLAVLFTSVNQGDADNSICQFYSLDDADCK